MSSEMNRRAFLARASLGVAGLAVASRSAAQMGGGGMGSGGMGGGGMGGSTGIVDPPVGDRLRDPPVVSDAGPGVGIDAAETYVPLNGTTRLLTYNGSFIAPTIRARVGDVVRLRFSNHLPGAGTFNILGHERGVTNVHVHGWHVSPGNNADGVPADNVHVMVPPGGGTQDYEYDLSKQRPGTLALYHPHVHGTVAEQFWGGLVGALTVDDGVTALQGIETHILVLKDLTIASGAPAPYTSLMEFMHGREGDRVMVNGQVNPYLEILPGEVKRLRFLNASTARFYRLALQGHTLHVVGSDGGLLDRPYAVPEILLSPGERVDVLVKASTTRASYKLLALPYARRGNMATPQITLMTLAVSGSRASGVIPAEVDPAAKRIEKDPLAPAPVQTARFTLSMGQGRGYINGQTFDVVGGQIKAFTHMSMVGTHEIWEIVNQSGMDHPWHQHVNDAQVIDISGGDAAMATYRSLYKAAPAYKDTIIVPKWGSVTLRIPIRDFTGMTMFHCHILEHEDIGMMGMWHIMEDGGGMPM